MKKTFAIMLTLLALVAFSTPAFAVAITSDSTTVIGGAEFVPSTGVTLQAISTQTAYAAQSKHLSGNKLYGTLNDSSDIAVAEDEVGGATDAPSNATTLSF